MKEETKSIEFEKSADGLTVTAVSVDLTALEQKLATDEQNLADAVYEMNIAQAKVSLCKENRDKTKALLSQFSQ